MLKIYVDTGGNTKQLRSLHAAGKILLVGADIDSHPFIPKPDIEVKSTVETWEKVKGTWTEAQGTWDAENSASEIYPAPVQLVGRNKDSRHLDTAYRSGCHMFLTNDKGDISDRRETIRGVAKPWRLLPPVFRHLFCEPSHTAARAGFHRLSGRVHTRASTYLNANSGCHPTPGSLIGLRKHPAADQTVCDCR